MTLSQMNSIIQEDIERIIELPLPWEMLEGKTVLISGANGFLPAYMVETILLLNKIKFREKTKVIALVRNIHKAKKKFAHHELNNNLIFLAQDVCDSIELDHQVDYIIHAASQASPKFYGVDPVGTLNANVTGTLNLLKLASKFSVKVFLYFSSSEVYGTVDEDKIPIKESSYGYLDPLKVRSCYGESKRMGENICISWMYQHNVPVKIIRPFHIYGPGMSLDDGRVYADFVSDIVNGRDIVMKSDGLNKRSFCYLGDATVAFFKVLLEGKAGEAYNIGNTNQEISILELANKLITLFPERNMKVHEYKIVEKSYLPSAVRRNSPDSSKINSLGWFPQTTIDEGFRRTIKSYG